MKEAAKFGDLSAVDQSYGLLVHFARDAIERIMRLGAEAVAAFCATDLTAL